MTMKYEFKWDLLGDIQLGRPNLGPTTRVEVYRLMQFAMRDVLERRLGTSKADELFYEAGYLAGQQFYEHVVKGAASLDELVGKLQRHLRELGIGILRVEESSPAGDGPAAR